MAAVTENEKSTNPDIENVSQATHNSLAPPATTSLGRPLQSVMNGHVPSHDGGSSTGETPLGSAPSTAPGSPRM